MRLTLRAKLTVIVGTATLAFVVIIVAGSLTLKHTQTELRRIEGFYLPKVDLGPRLEAQLEKMQRAYQDAVSAREEDAVVVAREAREAFLDLLGGAGEAVDRAQAAALRAALDDYDRAASDVSRRLIGGETGEPLVAAMGGMQQRRLRVVDLVRSATALEHGELARAFAETTRAMEVSARIRLWVAIICLLLVIALAAWMARGILRTMGGLTRGFERFGAGDFARPIVVASQDELGDVAARANEMAAGLRRLSEERERGDWLKAGVAGLVRELRGDLSPEDVGARSVRFLANTLGVPAAALYVAEDDGSFALVAEHGLGGPGAAAAAPRFSRGVGLVGRAALDGELTVIADPPADYLRIHSGLGDASPRAIVLLPLSQAGRVTGVLELATFKPWSEVSGELLLSVRETLAIAIVVARARAAMRDLLLATQRQAERLSAQEEELRSTNEELQAQEEELRQANTDLSRQTEELEAQRRMLAERNADLDEVRVRLEQRAAELATVSTYKSQFLSNMSHELRTPLNSMLLLSNLLADNEGGTLSPKQVDFARTIYGAGKDLLALINQVLDLAKVESGRQELELAPVALNEVVAQLQRIFAPLAAEKGLAFRATLAADVPAIVTDRRRVEQILTNLLGNAMKFTSRGEVTFRIERADPSTVFRRPELAANGAIALSVTDTGLGIAPEDHDRVFAPFEQVDGAADRRYGGTGLGLGIAREMATLLGGELQLTSTLGVGSTFTCLLPLTRAPMPTAGRAASNADLPVAGEQGPFLLLIEDDPIFAATFGEVIKSQGLRYVQARSGQAGLRIARERRPSGIILDVKLPDTDGWRVIETLRADPATAQIPVHFVSALDGAERGLALGAVGYLRKPVGRQDLVDVIEALVPRASARAARVLVVEDDALTASSVVKLLESEALEPTRVSTAEHALEALRRERFACMILDLSLPEMSGLDLLRTLRDEEIPDPPRVIVYTARSLSRVETIMIESYAEAVVLKDGSSVERLLDEVRLFVRRFDGARRAETPTPFERPRPDVRFDGCKVLLADDDMRTVYALSATLRAKGIDVVIAETGKAAVEALDAQPDVAVVLMDIMMPEMDGYEAMRRIRADGRFAALPIVALTAKAMKGDEERCVEAGATHYLPKPVDADRLVSLLATCLTRPEAGRLE